jgi:hypothetical protein
MKDISKYPKSNTKTGNEKGNLPRNEEISG